MDPNEEATFTHEELLAWAIAGYRKTKKWPLRRYRAERTIVGNSRLLSEKDAIRAAIRYQGQATEAIPELAAYAAGLSQQDRRQVLGL